MTMRLTIRPGAPLSGTALVPGDKSIAHRWLMLAGIATGTSSLADVPRSLDVRSTASVLAALSPHARPALEAWIREAPPMQDAQRFTGDGPKPRPSQVVIEGVGRASIEGSDLVLDCANSGTTMRLLSGLLAAHSGPFTLKGDASLDRRPMERVARPLRELGADVRTEGGHAPIRISGGALTGRVVRTEVPSAQIKGAVLLAGIAADGQTTLEEGAPTRDHTERALAWLGAPIQVTDGAVTVERFEVPAFDGRVPGDPSSASFLLAAAALSGGDVVIERVGLNPSRLAFLDVMSRMGLEPRIVETGSSVGEPFGRIELTPAGELSGVVVSARELPLIVDEVPVLAALASHASGETRFEGAGELRVKESDRLAAMSQALRATGGEAAVEGDALIVGGGGLSGGTVDPQGDHRIAMAMAVAGIASREGISIDGAECADVSFPGFAAVLLSLGADVEG